MFVHAYVHAGGKLAVLIHVEGPDAKSAELKAFADNAAMQVAAMNPIIIDKTNVSKAQIDKQRDLWEQLKGKPEQAWPRSSTARSPSGSPRSRYLGQDNV